MKYANLTFLNSFASSKPALVVQFISTFIKTAPETISEMKQAFADHDFHKMSRAAHSLKPQCSYMGIDQINESLVAIEEAEKNNLSNDKISDLLNTVSEICLEAVKELQDHLNTLNS